MDIDQNDLAIPPLTPPAGNELACLMGALIAEQYRQVVGAHSVSWACHWLSRSIEEARLSTLPEPRALKELRPFEDMIARSRKY